MSKDLGYYPNGSEEPLQSLSKFKCVMCLLLYETKSTSRMKVRGGPEEWKEGKL